MNWIRPVSRGHASTSAAWSLPLDAGSAVSTTTASGDESSSSSMTWASSPWPPPASMTRPPRSSRRTRRATSHASYSSFLGTDPALHTARPIRSKSVSPENRPLSYIVRRFREEDEKAMSKYDAGNFYDFPEVSYAGCDRTFRLHNGGSARVV